jgi:Protein of unknown function (DUF2971)
LIKLVLLTACDRLEEGLSKAFAVGFRPATLGGLSTEIENLVNSWRGRLVFDTYLTCISEHRNKEDPFGRLSMWRGYGETTGVALVMNNSPFLTPSDALKACTSPVAYPDQKEFEKQFGRVVNNIESEIDFLRQKDRQLVKNYLFRMLVFAAVSTKHPGFEEEKEWRIVYFPRLEKSDYLVKDIQVIQGVPQPIYKIPLKDIPDEVLAGAKIPALINRIIIGPTKYPPQAIWEAFRDLLAEAGVENPDDRVVASEIPLRQ